MKYTIIPSARSMVIDGSRYTNVAMTGIPGNVQAIQWDDLRGEGRVEYKVNPFTGIAPDPVIFTDSSRYQTQISGVNYPLIVYAIEDGATYYGQTFNATEQLRINESPNPVVPAGFTTQVPDHPASPTSLTNLLTSQWDANTLQWINAAFPISNTVLASVQSFLSNLINTARVNHINGQLGIYSTIDIVQAPDAGALVPAGYGTTHNYATMTDYIAAADAIATPLLNTVAAATTIADLHDFNPYVSAPA